MGYLLTRVTAQQQWLCVGTVVDGGGSSGKKVEYNGQSYDYVFDVDIEDGAPPLKLPYNLSQNPYEAATKFLGDNELPLTYLDNVTDFIVQNTKGATLGQGSGPATDEFGTGRYQPGDGSESQPPPVKKILPQSNYLMLATAKFEPVVKKIMSTSATMISSGRKDFALNPTEEAILKQFTENLAESIATVPATVPGTTAAAATQPLTFSEHDVTTLLKLINLWPDNDRLPGLDLLRCAATSPGMATAIDPNNGNSIIDIALQAAFQPAAGAKINENCAMMAFRVITNLFATVEGRQVAYEHAHKVVDHMESLVGLNSSAFPGPVGFPGNRNVLMAVTTAALNYAVLAWLVKNKKVTLQHAVPAEVFGLMANVLCRVLKSQSDAEVNYRALAAVGTFAAAGYAEAMASFGADEAVRKAKGDKTNEERVRNIAGECLQLLS